MKAKVCLVGEAAVGKTSLVRRFVYDQFSDAYQTTLRAKVVSRDIEVPTEDGPVAVKLMIWDIIGESSLLRVISEAYFDGVQGIVAVCDLTRYSTFEALAPWLDTVQRIAGDVPKALAVNKIDLKGEVLVLYDEHRVRQYAEEIGGRSCMTSAKTGENVEGMFAGIAADIVARARTKPVEETWDWDWGE